MPSKVEGPQTWPIGRREAILPLVLLALLALLLVRRRPYLPARCLVLHRCGMHPYSAEVFHSLRQQRFWTHAQALSKRYQHADAGMPVALQQELQMRSAYACLCGRLVPAQPAPVDL